MKIKEKIKALPLFCKICFPLFFISVFVKIFAVLCCPFADFFNTYIAGIVRLVLAKLTSVLPFSISELMVWTLPFLLALAIFLSNRKVKRDKKLAPTIAILLSIASLFYTLFIFTYDIGYRTTKLANRLNYEKNELSSEELYDTAVWLTDELNVLAEELNFSGTEQSYLPYSFEEMNKKLNVAYKSCAVKYSFINSFSSRVKQVSSEGGHFMSTTHILGMYTYFTGEANVNTTPPDYNAPYTSAHEMAHQRGIAREDEANFVAFLVCMESDDAYIRYCGYLSVLEYLLNSLYSADYELFVSASRRYPAQVYYDMVAYNEYYDEYRDNPIGEVSRKMNDFYLKSQGTEGRKSYDLVTTLAVNYYLCEVAN